MVEWVVASRTPAGVRAKKKSDAKRYASLKASGRCTKCLGPASPGSMMCVPCADKYRETSAAWHTANPNHYPDYMDRIGFRGRAEYRMRQDAARRARRTDILMERVRDDETNANEG